MVRFQTKASSISSSQHALADRDRRNSGRISRKIEFGDGNPWTTVHEPRPAHEYMKKKSGLLTSLWIAPTIFAANSRVKEKKTQEFEERGSLLRDNPPGRRPIELVGMDDALRVEPDPAAAEEEVRRVIPADLRIRIVALVARQIHPEVVVVDEPLGVRQQHAAARHRAVAELNRHARLDIERPRRKHHANPANRATAMPHADLTVVDQDVARLLLPDELQSGDRTGVLPQAVGTELAFAPVLELALALGLESREDFDNAVIVGVVEEIRTDVAERRFGSRGLRQPRQHVLRDFHAESGLSEGHCARRMSIWSPTILGL